MRLVNLSKSNITSFDPVYISIEQPMPIYYSVEELAINEPDKHWVVCTAKELYDSMNRTLATSDKYPSHKVVFIKGLEEYRLFLSTGEKFKMRGLDIERGMRVPIQEEPVENNYIQVYAIANRMNSVFHIYTSSGVWALNNKGFTVTGAISPVYRNEVQWNKFQKAANKQKTTEKKLHRLIKGKTLLADDYKFTGLFMNEKSPTYLNLFASAHMAYNSGNNRVSMEQVNDILSSERVRNLILNQMRIFMPSLEAAIKDVIDPKKMAKMLMDIAEQAIKSEIVTVDDKLKAVQAIANVGYMTEGIILNTETPGAEKLLAMKGTETQPIIGANYNDEDVKIVGAEEIVGEKIKEEKYAEIAEEVGLIHGTTAYDPNAKPKPSDP